MDPFWDPFWTHLGGQNRSNMGQVGLKTRLETIFFEKSDFSRKALKTHRKLIKMSPRAVIKQPKIAPRWPQDGLEDSFFSYLFLFSILVRFGCDLGSLWDHFWEPKSIIFEIDFWMIFVCRSKIAPRAAKSCPRAAKSLPRGSQERPREPQGCQKVTQERPRVAKTDPRGAQEVRKENER